MGLGDIRFIIRNIIPNKTYGRWSYEEIRSIKELELGVGVSELNIIDFPEFIDNWEDYISEFIWDYINYLYPPDRNYEWITYMFDCDLYDGDKLLTKYFLLSSFGEWKDIKDVLTGEYKIWNRNQKLIDLGL